VLRSAWCGFCKTFTPKLIEAYKTIKADKHKPFEMVFISADRNQPGEVPVWNFQPSLARFL
jgi:hypothetical protein